MTDLFTQIKKDRIAARKAKDLVRATLLTTLVGEAEQALKGKQADKFDMLKLVEKFRTNVIESLAIKSDPILQAELEILDEYIPTKMSEEQIETFISPILSDNGGIKEVMQYFNKTLKPSGAVFDNKLVQEVTKRMMSSI